MANEMLLQHLDLGFKSKITGSTKGGHFCIYRASHWFILGEAGGDAILSYPTLGEEYRG